MLLSGAESSSAPERSPLYLMVQQNSSTAHALLAPVGVERALLAAARIKRCHFRRHVALDTRAGRVYEVECLLPDRSLPMPLGDLEAAMPICNTCAASGIFRADED